MGNGQWAWGWIGNRLCESKRRLKDEPEAFGFCNRKNGFAIVGMERLGFDEIETVI